MSTRWWRIGSYIWTACSAGWLVLFALTELPECFVVSALCAVASLGWNLLIKPEEGGTPRSEGNETELP
jgi:hypothetical protein